MPTDPWSGATVTRAREYMARKLPAPCAVCGKTVATKADMHVGHIKSRASFPRLILEPSNWQVEHAKCSLGGAQKVVQEKARRDALLSVGIDPDSGFYGETDGPKSPLLSTPPISEETAISIPERLLWDRERLSEASWLVPLLDVPGDAAPPLAMTAPRPFATGSYGEEAIAWIEKTQKITLRWWQRLAITRQLEYDPLGRLLWRVIVESGPRRIGKSVRLRGVALWRLEHGADLFGETQLVMHTGKDVAIVREIQKAAWRWSEGEAGWKVGRGRGSEQIETPDGDRWLAKAKDAVYGYDVCLGMVDEGWGVDPGAVDEGLEPATMERPSPQVHLTSTAHRKATSLMRRRIADALAAEDGETLLMLWAAPPGSDPGDPATWRAASAHWSESREKQIAAKYTVALAGEVDPEADDLDPMAGFTAQYLNMWSLKDRRAAPGEVVIEEAAWTALRADLPAEPTPEAVAVEGWAGERVSVAFASRVEDRVVVSVRQVDDLLTAAVLIGGSGFRGRTVVGASFIDDPAFKGMAKVKRSGTPAQAVADAKVLLGEGVLLHDGGAYLTGQLLGLRTVEGLDAPKIVSKGPVDGVKAAVWAAQEARSRRNSGIRTVISV